MIQIFKYCDLVIHQIWRITEKKRDGMASRLEATVFQRYIKWILVIKSFWIPGLSLRDPCKSRVSSVYAQILVLAIWYVIGVIVLCCVVIYTSEMMHDYQGVGSRAEIYFVHFKKKSL